MIIRLKQRLHQRRRRAAIRRAIAALPVVAGWLPCADCWARPGQAHELSCVEVSYEQAMAVVHPHGEEAVA